MTIKYVLKETVDFHRDINEFSGNMVLGICFVMATSTR